MNESLYMMNSLHEYITILIYSDFLVYGVLVLCMIYFLSQMMVQNNVLYKYNELFLIAFDNYYKVHKLLI